MQMQYDEQKVEFQRVSKKRVSYLFASSRKSFSDRKCGEVARIFGKNQKKITFTDEEFSSVFEDFRVKFQDTFIALCNTVLSSRRMVLEHWISQ